MKPLTPEFSWTTPRAVAEALFRHAKQANTADNELRERCQLAAIDLAELDQLRQFSTVDEVWASERCRVNFWSVFGATTDLHAERVMAFRILAETRPVPRQALANILASLDSAEHVCALLDEATGEIRELGCYVVEKRVRLDKPVSQRLFRLALESSTNPGHAEGLRLLNWRAFPSEATEKPLIQALLGSASTVQRMTLTELQSLLDADALNQVLSTNLYRLALSARPLVIEWMGQERAFGWCLEIVRDYDQVQSGSQQSARLQPVQGWLFRVALVVSELAESVGKLLKLLELAAADSTQQLLWNGLLEVDARQAVHWLMTRPEERWSRYVLEHPGWTDESAFSVETFWAWSLAQTSPVLLARALRSGRNHGLTAATEALVRECSVHPDTKVSTLALMRLADSGCMQSQEELCGLSRDASEPWAQAESLRWLTRNGVLVDFESLCRLATSASTDRGVRRAAQEAMVAVQRTKANEVFLSHYLRTGELLPKVRLAAVAWSKELGSSTGWSA